MINFVGRVGRAGIGACARADGGSRSGRRACGDRSEETSCLPWPKQGRWLMVITNFWLMVRWLVSSKVQVRWLGGWLIDAINQGGWLIDPLTNH